MNQFAVNIPLEFTVKDELIDEIHIYQKATFPEITFGNNNFTSYVKLSLENMLNKFNSKYLCDCNNKIQNAISKHIAEQNSKLQIMELKHQAEIDIKQQQENIIRKEYEDRIKNIEYKYSLDIQEKDNQLEKSKSIINEEIHTVFGEKERQYMLEIQKKESEIEMLNYKLQNSMNEFQKADGINKELTEIRECIHKVFRNNSAMGAVGENFIYEYIREYMNFADCKIVDVSGQSNACDISIEYKSIKCGIESKNHTNNVKSEDIRRFTETDIANPNYNCGIFCSVKSEFVHVSNIKHFDIKFYHNKPVIFLTEVSKKPQNIIYAIKTLEFIISNNSKSQNEINTIIQSVRTMIQAIEKIQRNNNQVIKIMKEANKDIEEIQKNIRKLLGEEIPQAKKIHTCEICQAQFEKKVEYNRHLKRHQ